MPNPEKPTNKVETAAEVSRETLEHRGEKTLEAKAQTEEAEKAKRIAELRAQIAEEDAKIAEIDAKLAELDAKEAEQKTSDEAPVEEETPGGAEAGAENEETGENEDDSVEKTGKKGKKSPGLKKLLITATAIILAGAVGVGAAVANGFGKKKNPAPSPNPSPKVESVMNTGEEAEKIGIYDGYGEKGMWLSETKTGPYNFANASEVAEDCNNDAKEIIKKVATNQVESFADYLANFPEELQPEGFKGLSIIETEQKLESLSDEEYEAVKKHFNEVIDNSSVDEVVLNGSYDNAYMRLKDSDGPVTHENMELVRCTTNENNSKATRFSLKNTKGEKVGEMISKMSAIYDEDGNIEEYGPDCTQVTLPSGMQVKIFSGMAVIKTPDKETPDPDETIKPKDAENLERIDKNINEDIAEDINTDEVVVTPTPSGEVTKDTVTEKPSGEDYEGTGPNIVENESAGTAESVEDKVSKENNYSENRGGANASNAAENPVKPNENAQAEADRNETPVGEAPTSNEIDDILKDLGIY